MNEECLPLPELRGGNLLAYQSRAPEHLCWGPAGTGKTLAGMLKIVHLAMIFPKTRAFILRKTRASLTDAALLTLEQEVLGPDSPVLTKRPLLRETRRYYEFSNGSVIVPVGMDKPEKLFSVPFNWGYINELTELEQDDYQSLKRALRWPAKTAVNIPGRITPAPCNFIASDCNPSYQHHWVNQRMKSGQLKGFRSVHEDNPAYYDLETKTWTAAGQAYIEDQLGSLTGFMRERLLKGKWAAAEGLVYEDWNEDTHMLEPYARKGDGSYDVTKPTISPSWPRYWGIDWGSTHSMVLQMWAKDGDGRIYLYREWHQTKRLVDDLADWAKNEVIMGREPRPLAIVTDHDPLNEGAFTKRSGFPTVQADKAGMKRTHVQSPMARMKIQKDGRPRVYVIKGYLAHPPDKLQIRAGKPTCFTEEVVGYQWDTDKDTPQDGEDDSMDTFSYVSNYIDTKGSGGWGIR